MSAADERARELWLPRIFYGPEYSTDLNGPLREAFVAGAEWQAEQDKTGLDAVSELHYRQADAVLAASPILAGVTDEMVERGAVALRDHWRSEEPELPGWDAIPDSAREFTRAEVRAVLLAVLSPREDQTEGSET